MMRTPWSGPVLVLLALAGCLDEAAAPPEHAVPGADPERGRVALQSNGCASCHAIPGVEAVQLIVGPPLEEWSERQYIAGKLPNHADNLILWIVDPHAVEPGTAMPNLGVDRETAADMAAYLYTLGQANPPMPVDSPRAERVY